MFRYKSLSSVFTYKTVYSLTEKDTNKAKTPVTYRARAHCITWYNSLHNSLKRYLSTYKLKYN